MKILITGATGLIGQEIVKLCHQAGYSVHYLTTRKQKVKAEDTYKGFLWNPVKGEIDEACFDGVEVIIHLVGATVAKRWTPSYRQEIMDSRVQTTALITNALSSIRHTVRHIVSASAIGIYQDSLQNYYTEESTETDAGFLGQVVTAWENAVLAHKKLDIEVSLIRIGLVLSATGGAFPKIKKPIAYGMGAIFGSGKQWQSWVHIQDIARIFLFVVEEELLGVFNGVAPEPVSNKKMTHAIARVLGKKIRLPNVPAFAMHLLLGEMYQLLFASHRVSSAKIIKNGFRFKYGNITTALEALCADDPSK